MKKPCEACGGTGQISYFQGESRFLLTHEECQDCFGTGIFQVENDGIKKESPENDDSSKEES